MIPVFVLSLPDCHERRSRITASLNHLGIPLEFVDGVDGRNGLPPEYESQIDREAARRAGHLLCDAEFACSLSHIKIYRKIVEEKIEYALILEDDIQPLPTLVEYLSGRYYEDAELTQLRYSKAYVRRKGVKPLFGDYTSHLRAPRMNISGAWGYVISRNAALHFIENALPITKEADWPDCIETLVAQRKCRVVSPSTLILHKEGNEGSLINKAGRADNKESRRLFGVYVPLFKKMAHAYNRAWRKPFCKRLPTPPFHSEVQHLMHV